jgi:flagellar protein FliO/FliZ
VKPNRALSAALAVAPLCVLLAPATVLAAGRDPYHEQTPLNLPADSGVRTADVGGSSSGSLARTFVGLAVVVAVIYGLTWVLRQMKKSSSAERSVGFGLSTEASMPLGPGRSVHLIRAGRELVLVGSAEHGIVPIRTYTEEEAEALGLLAAPQLGDGDGAAGAFAATAPTTAAGRVRVAVSGVLQQLRDRTMR